MKRFLSLTLMLAAATANAAAQAGAPAANTPAAAQVAVVEDCGCEAMPLPEVLAVVNGVKLTPRDLSQQVRDRVEELQRQVVEARRVELDLQINSILLEAEAKRRGVTTTKVLEDEVVAKTTAPTEADALAFYNQNRERIEAQAGSAVELKDVKENILAHLRAERQQELAGKLSDRLRAAANVKVLVKEVTPPKTEADRARVFATVNGTKITSADIETSLMALIYGVQEEVYRLRQRELDLKVNDTLLAHEAQKKQLTMRALLDAEVDSKVTAATDAQALEFYNQNKDRIEGDFAKTKDQIVRYLAEVEGRKLLVALAERLRKDAGVQTFLAAPVSPIFQIATDDQPSKGGVKAAVTIVEFTDFQCPSCAQVQPVLDRLVSEYGGRVRLVARDYPLPQHAEAFKAAEAAEAAREQGKYWEYTAKLFGNQSALGVDNLKRFATEVGLNRAKFDAALDGSKFNAAVRRDLFDGQKVGVNGTPSLFINGRRVSDRSYDGLKAAIDAALNTSEGK
jgi:protein-disulfide isomerase